MKLGKHIFTVLLVTILTSTISFGQQQDAPGPERYVIIGVFRVLDNAVRFTDKANKQSFQAGYIQNPRNKLYYVYIFQTLESKKAFAFMMQIRLETEFKEAWVYKGSLGAPIQEAPVTQTPVEKPAEEPVTQPIQEPVITTPIEEPKEDSVATSLETPVEKPAETPVETPKVDSAATKMEPKPVGKPFFFKLVSGDTQEPLVGEIHVYEPNGATQTYQAFPANQVVYLPAPRDPSQVYAISTLSAGYQEMRRSINYVDPASSSAEIGSGSEFIIALPLVHVKMGDYIEFSSVTFFQNSVMLHPESKEELDGLAELLKQNPRYKVNIHAHCNGTQDRNIIVRKNNTEFFGSQSTQGAQRKTVSSKALTELRADLVKEYLVSQGVEGKRVSTKGEGGAALIYPVNSTLANRNDRVEVEVKRGK
jgi:outer membrane protein OmpA-like peptidoglycan-associated protein